MEIPARCSVLLTLVLALAAEGLYAETYIHPRLKSRQKTIHAVTLLPPTAEGSKKDQTGDALASEIARVLLNALRAKGWEVNDSPFSSQALQSDGKLKNLVDYLRTRHQTLARQMMNRPKDVAIGRYTLGADVANLGLPAPTDVLVLAYGSPLLFVGPIITQWNGQPKYTLVHISLVDPLSGEVLCYVKALGAVEKRILKGLREIP